MESLGSRIYVWFIDHDKENYIKCLELKKCLSVEELNYANQFKFERDRKSYIISHVYLRLLLSHFMDIPPSQIKFKKNEFGKPYIENNSNYSLYFNLSHSHKKTMIGFYKNEIGVDIEYVEEAINIRDICHLILTTSEIGLLEKLPQKNKISMFYDMWTRKEALFKALGIGLNNEMKNIDISNLDLIYTNNIDSKLNFQKWKIKSLTIENSGYSASIAFRNVEPIEIHITQF